MCSLDEFQDVPFLLVRVILGALLGYSVLLR